VIQKQTSLTVRAFTDRVSFLKNDLETLKGEPLPQDPSRSAIPRQACVALSTKALAEQLDDDWQTIKPWLGVENVEELLTKVQQASETDGGQGALGDIGLPREVVTACVSYASCSRMISATETKAYTAFLAEAERLNLDPILQRPVLTYADPADKERQRENTERYERDYTAEKRPISAMLRVDFHPRVAKMLREGTYWYHLGHDIPPQVETLVGLGHKLMLKRRAVLQAARKYNEVLSNLSDSERILFGDKLGALTEVVLPGIQSLGWLHPSLDRYVNNVCKQTEETLILVRKFHASKAAISDVFRRVSGLVAFNLRTESGDAVLVTPEEFLSTQKVVHTEMSRKI
ncbi:dynein heavy chain, partial [Kipferlia bialata]